MKKQRRIAHQQLKKIYSNALQNKVMSMDSDQIERGYWEEHLMQIWLCMWPLNTTKYPLITSIKGLWAFYAGSHFYQLPILFVKSTQMII